MIEGRLKSIPRFPESRKIELADRATMGAFLDSYPTEISERTFGSIFVWRNYEGRSELSQVEGHLIISWYKRGIGRVALPPVGPEPAGVAAQLAKPEALAMHKFEGIYGVVEPLSGSLSSLGLRVDPLRDDWDYVYRVMDLIELQGPKYHTQRKELKKVLLNHDLSFEPLTKGLRSACLELEEKWCDIKHCSVDKYSHAEDGALKEAILHMDELGFVGGVAIVDGRVQALAVGERLNSNTATVHFEKANPEIRGLYQFINQQFCENVLSEYEFVNREQDVGEPGLRRAKEGYHPDHFVQKGIALLGRTPTTGALERVK